MKAIIVVDTQNDFCPGGSLAVADGDGIIANVNKLTKEFAAAGLPVVFTRDWHPENHSSFSEYGGIWPEHCIKGTSGADFHPDLHQPDNSIIISKAESADKDAYSGFEGTELDSKLKTLEVDELVIAGLATDYCVKNTVLDALRLGYKTTVAADCVRAVNVKPGDGEAALNEMKKAGALTADSSGIHA